MHGTENRKSLSIHSIQMKLVFSPSAMPLALLLLQQTPSRYLKNIFFCLGIALLMRYKEKSYFKLPYLSHKRSTHMEQNTLMSQRSRIFLRACIFETTRHRLYLALKKLYFYLIYILHPSNCKNQYYENLILSPLSRIC